MIKKIWNDPVWSKIIATAIICLIGTAWGYRNSWFPSVQVPKEQTISSKHETSNAADHAEVKKASNTLTPQNLLSKEHKIRKNYQVAKPIDQDVPNGPQIMGLPPEKPQQMSTNKIYLDNPLDINSGKAPNLEILRQSEAIIAQVQKTAETSEAEFLTNSQIKISLVPFPEGMSNKLADFISKDLTTVGFKIYRAPWGEKKDIFKGLINIVYQPFVVEKAEYVAKVVETIIDRNKLNCNVHLTSAERPISNSDTNIALFFE